MSSTLEHLVRIVDDLEGRADGYVVLPQVEAVCGPDDVAAAIAEHVLLVDYRARFDISTQTASPVTLCRLNRQHPLVKQLTAW